jgi:23S rRNA (guanosine2251-2'-O)-methyltransferase
MAGGRTTASRRRTGGARRHERRTRLADDRPLIVYGANAVLELLHSGAPVTRLSLSSGGRAAELAAAAETRGVRAAAADAGALERLAGSPHHQGAVAETPPFEYAPLDRLLAPNRASALVLDGIQDPRNLGALLRTARAAGVGGVVLPRDRSVGVTGVVVAASAGLAFGLPIARVPNLVRAMEALKEAGFWLVGLAPQGGRPLLDLDRPPRPALVVGGEGAGMRPLVRKTCDFVITIPMAPGVEPLNVAVAAGIALYTLAAPRTVR